MPPKRAMPPPPSTTKTYEDLMKEEGIGMPGEKVGGILPKNTLLPETKSEAENPGAVTTAPVPPQSTEIAGVVEIAKEKPITPKEPKGVDIEPDGIRFFSWLMGSIQNRYDPVLAGERSEEISSPATYSVATASPAPSEAHASPDTTAPGFFAALAGPFRNKWLWAGIAGAALLVGALYWVYRRNLGQGSNRVDGRTDEPPPAATESMEEIKIETPVDDRPVGPVIEPPDGTKIGLGDYFPAKPRE